MKRKTRILSLLALIAIFLGAYGLSAGPGHGKRGHGKHLARMKKMLQLTSEQEQKIRGIFKKYIEIQKQIHGEMIPVHEELHKLMLKQGVSRSEVKEQLEKMSELHVKSRLARFDKTQEISEVLNEKQRKKWMQQRKKRMKKRMERHKKKFSKSEMDM